ncbi:Cse1-domain-containing protein [Metschnikowia bicuspidata var. bicuspidata NRRL YB-4993]|uniref:Cse1-domain-containing protein n=1 Tax=Metschnikowia bicuspidata var. bicuspidata NRRL YB-4993 TaxID=869754 RepID=A0A1A0H8B2_9ASCO|nr:Cse1-domain-containing protein [Metschnikowia bicuspidata var. bicuspidata NRRL YB-4993]OBA20127.1 Cse1-domain-containing protein [Metschnikowia bicuspidata var. bicuspidata NRRL YB-4993]
MAENSLETIPIYLKESLDPRNAKEAEAHLRAIECQPHFAINLLNVVASSNLDSSVRLAGSLFLKNLVKRKWVNEDGEYLLFTEDIQYLKAEILNVMIKLPNNIQAQLGETISIIAELDFPRNWENLIDELVTRLSAEDFVLNRGILLVAHSIFKKWRPLFRSDELFLEIKMVLDKFAQPFMALFVRTDELVTEALNQTNGANLAIYLECLLLEVQIYYDLNCQDIPEFFEDNLATGMSIMHKYLTLKTPLVGDADDDEDIDVLIKTKSAILELISLYVTRYSEEFEPVTESFITSVWELVNTGVTKQPKFDLLTVKALSFLTSISQVSKYQSFFDNEQAIREIIEKIILPNIVFRDVDEEMFEDEPIAFVRSDLEGSDFDSRRKSSTDFLRELKEVNTTLLTNTVMSYVNEFLSHTDWRNRDIAIYLFTSLAAKGSVTNMGVTSTNLLVDVVGFFTSNIASYLVEDASPILKADAIKYIMTFRNQLTKEQLLTTVPLLENHIKHENAVVYTYAAITIEKLFAMTSFTNSAHLPVFDKNDIQPYASNLLHNLFARILSSTVPEKLSENEFLIRTVMRVLSTAENTIAEPFKAIIIGQLLYILSIIAKNPANPRFTHYVFESLGLLIKFSSAPKAEVTPNYIALIMPALLQILSEDVQEFVPYTFQILAFLLEELPSSNALPEQYAGLVKPILSPVVWEYRGNVPGVTRLIIAIMKHDSAVFARNAQELTPLLGVFQKLIASRANDSYGFDLLEGILLNMPLNLLTDYFNQIAILLLTRLKSSRTEKFIKKFVLFLLSLSCVPLNQTLSTKTGINADFVINLLDSAQQGVFQQIFTSFILPTSESFTSLQDKKVSALGLSQLATSSGFTQGNYKVLVVPTVEQLCKNLSLLQGISNKASTVTNTTTGDTNTTSVAINDLDLESAAYGSSFSRLVSIHLKLFDPLPDVKSDDFNFIESAAVSNVKKLEQLGVVNQLSENARSFFTKYSN